MRIFWRHFKTQAEARQAIRSIFSAQPFNEPFEAPLVSDLIHERHYHCSKHNLRPSRFRKLPGINKYTVEGDFPGIGWKAVSWTKCLSRPLTEWDYIKRAMRDHIVNDKLRFRDAHPVCQDCGRAPSVEVHHKKPSVEQIALSIRAKVTEVDISSCLANWNWFHTENFSLPSGHIITMLFQEAHRSAQLKALCIDCHNKTKSKRGAKLGEDSSP
jgi:5-methylcytosine-specific restriction endonuclease McrA